MHSRLMAALLLIALSGCALLQPSGPKGLAPTDSPDLRVGERWTYSEFDGYNRSLSGTWTREIAAIDDVHVTVQMLRQNDEHKIDLRGVYSSQWGMISQTLPDGHDLTFSPPLINFPFSLEPGKRWDQEVVVTDAATGKQRTWRVWGKVLGWEKVKVPAGEFNALKILRYVHLPDAYWWDTSIRRTEVDWYVPEVKWIVKHEESEEFRRISRKPRIQRGARSFWELISYTTK